MTTLAGEFIELDIHHKSLICTQLHSINFMPQEKQCRFGPIPTSNDSNSRGPSAVDKA
jgi:hypothetical protein